MKIADLSYWWLLFPAIHWPLNRGLTSLFYKQRTMGTFALMQISWISVLVFQLFHRYSLLEHLDANSNLATVLMAVNPTKIFMWILAAYQAEESVNLRAGFTALRSDPFLCSYGRTPNWRAKKSREDTLKLLLPGEHAVMIVPEPVSVSHFAAVGWKRLEEASAGIRAPINNPILWASASAGALLGLGSNSSAATSTPATTPTPVAPTTIGLTKPPTK